MRGLVSILRLEIPFFPDDGELKHTNDKNTIRLDGGHRRSVSPRKQRLNHGKFAFGVVLLFNCNFNKNCFLRADLNLTDRNLSRASQSQALVSFRQTNEQCCS